MSTYSVSLKIDASAAEAGARAFQAAADAIKRGLDGLGGGSRGIDQATEALSRFQRVRDSIERSTGISGRSDAAQRSADIQAYGAEIDRLRAKYVPLAASQQQYLAQLREIYQAQKTGVLSHGEAAAAIDRTKSAFVAQVAALKTAGDAMKATSDSMKATGESAAFLRNRALTLQYTLSDITASLASGASPFTILMQQGGQVAQVFSKASGGPGVMAAALGALTSPIALAVAGFAALAGAAVAVLVRANDMSKEQRLFAGELQATGRQAELTTKQLHDMVEAMRDAGIAKNDARDALSAALRTPGLASSRVPQITALTPNAAAGLGTDAATAAKALADIAANGYPAIEKFALANNALDAAQLKVIRSMAQQGDQAGAVDKAMQLLDKRYENLAANSLSPLDKALNSVGRAWTGFMDSIVSSRPVIALLNSLAWAMDRVAGTANYISGASFASKSGLSPQDQVAQQEDTVRYLREQTSTVQPFNRPDHELRIQQAEQELARLREALPKPTTTSGSATPGSGTGTNTPVVRTAQQLEIDKANEELARRQRVLAASPVNRSIVQARVDIEADTTLDGDINNPASEKGRRALIAEKRAREELAVAVRDQTAAVNANVAGSMAAAEAYQTSAAAGIEADARRQASTEALTQAINVNVRTREILQEKLAGELVAASQQLETNRNEVANAERLADAQKNGAAAYAEAELAIKQQMATQQLSILLQVAEKNGTAAQVEQFRQLISERKEQIAAIELANRATQQSIDLRKADQDVALARQGASAAQITDPTERRAAEIAIERQREYNRLLEVAKGDTKYIAEMLQRWDLKTAADEQARFWSDVRQEASTLAKDVGGFLTDGVTGALNNGKSNFKDFWDGALQGGKRFLTRMLATFAEQKIILPIAMSIVGSIPGAFGISSPAGASSGGFSMGGVGDIASVGKMIPGVSNWINGAVDSIGLATGLGGGLVAPTAAMASAGVAASTTAATAGLAAETAIAGNTAVSGALTGASGLSAALPYVGAGIMAVSLLTSFLGGKKSVGPGGGIGFGAGEDGKIKIGFTSQDNGYDPVAKNSDAAQAVVDGALKFFKQIGGTYKGTGVADRGAELGYDAGLKKYVGGDDTSNGKGRFDTLEQAMAASLIAVVKNSIVDGVSKDIQDRIRAVSTAQDMENLLTYIAQLNQVYDAFKNWAPPLTAAEQSINNLNAAYEQAKSAADSLSKSTDDLKASYEKQKAYLISEFNAPLKERELRAKGFGLDADLLANDRQAADTMKQAKALGPEAVLQAEKTLQAERLRIQLSYIEQAKSAEAQAQQARLAPLKATYDALVSELQSMRNVWKGIAEQMIKFRDSLKVGQLSTLSPEQQMLEAQRQYSSLLSKARGGDANAAGELQNAAQLALQQTQSYYASGEGYAQYFDQVQADLTDFSDYASKQASLADQALGVQKEVAANTRTMAQIMSEMDAARKALANAGAATTGAANDNRSTGLDGGGFGDASKSNSQNIADAYKNFWGRDAADWEIQAWNDVIAKTGSASQAIASIQFAPQATAMQTPAAATPPRTLTDIAVTSLNELPADITTLFKGYASGGDHPGGWRLVGERGPELEATGPARIFNFDQTRELLSAPASRFSDSTAIVAAIDGVTRSINAFMRMSAEAHQANLDTLDVIVDELRAARRGSRFEYKDAA